MDLGNDLGDRLVDDVPAAGGLAGVTAAGGVKNITVKNPKT